MQNLKKTGASNPKFNQKVIKVRQKANYILLGVAKYKNIHTHLVILFYFWVAIVPLV